MPRIYKLRPGEKAVVTVDIAKETPVDPIRRGIIEPYVDPDYPGRRLSGGMNFWDLGMVSTGSGPTHWEMLGFQPSPCPYGTSSQVFNTTWHEELLAKIFEVPVEEWSTHYKKIVPDMNYPLEVGSMDTGGASFRSYELASAPEFTSKGLKVSSDFYDSNRLLRINGLGNYVSLFRTEFLQKGASSTTSGVRVTSTYDPGAAEVAFEPSTKCEVYLVPALPYVLARFDYREAGGTPIHIQQLNEFFHLYDRGIVLTPAHAGSGLDMFGKFENSFGNPNEGSQIEYDKFLAFAAYADGFDNARARYLISFPTWGDFGTATEFADVLPGSYSFSQPSPMANAEGTVTMEWAIDGNTSNTSLGGSSDNQMLLRAVIRQNGEFFYIWNYENTP